jgi:Bacterial regulatory helix-turn-helix protein, lysR family
MEMHQIRYFLALSETLNFTKAAERCNVAQPSLTRLPRKVERRRRYGQGYQALCRLRRLGVLQLQSP